MCNINAIINTTGKKSTKITECINVVSYHSFIGNNDADGYYTEDFKVKKSIHKMIIKGSHSRVISHQRISTSGKTADMAQPLESENFILVHNGVMREVDNIKVGNEKESDTWEYLQKFEEYYALSNDTIKTIKQINKETQGGYSIIVYNKNTKEHYYYKNSLPNMYVAISKNYIMLSTKKDNVEYMQKYFMEESDLEEVVADKIYNLNDNFKEVASFEPYVYIYKPYKAQTTLSPIDRGRYSRSDDWERDEDGYYKKYTRRKHSSSASDSQRAKIVSALEQCGYKKITCGMHTSFCVVGVASEDGDSFSNLFPNETVTKSPKGGRARYEVSRFALEEFAKEYFRQLQNKVDEIETGTQGIKQLFQ